MRGRCPGEPPGSPPHSFPRRPAGPGPESTDGCVTDSEALGRRLSHSPVFVPFLFRKVGQAPARNLSFSQKLN